MSAAMASQGPVPVVRLADMPEGEQELMAQFLVAEKIKVSAV